MMWWGEDADEYLRTREVEAHNILLENWATVEAIAAALLKQGKLTRPEIISIILNAQGDAAGPNKFTA
jgi:hypothetical protein